MLSTVRGGQGVLLSAACSGRTAALLADLRPHPCRTPPHLGRGLCVTQLRQQRLAAAALLLIRGQHGDDAADSVAAAPQVGADGAAYRAQDSAARVAVCQRFDGGHVLLDDVGGGGAWGEGTGR